MGGRSLSKGDMAEDKSLLPHNPLREGRTGAGLQKGHMDGRQQLEAVLALWKAGSSPLGQQLSLYSTLAPHGFSLPRLLPCSSTPGLLAETPFIQGLGHIGVLLSARVALQASALESRTKCNLPAPSPCLTAQSGTEGVK